MRGPDAAPWVVLELCAPSAPAEYAAAPRSVSSGDGVASSPAVGLAESAGGVPTPSPPVTLSPVIPSRCCVDWVCKSSSCVSKGAAAASEWPPELAAAVEIAGDEFVGGADGSAGAPPSSPELESFEGCRFS